MGIDVELEHGLQEPQTNVTGSDPIVTGTIALAHLKEFPAMRLPPRPEAKATAELISAAAAGSGLTGLD